MVTWKWEPVIGSSSFQTLGFFVEDEMPRTLFCRDVFSKLTSGWANEELRCAPTFFTFKILEVQDAVR